MYSSLYYGQPRILTVVIPHVGYHPSMLYPSSVLINCVIGKQSLYKHGLAFGVFVPFPLIGYL
jgi:hypothetical protein